MLVTTEILPLAIKITYVSGDECLLHIKYTVVPAFNGPSDERTPAMAGHFLNVRTILPC